MPEPAHFHRLRLQQKSPVPDSQHCLQVKLSLFLIWILKIWWESTVNSKLCVIFFIRLFIFFNLLKLFFTFYFILYMEGFLFLFFVSVTVLLVPAISVLSVTIRLTNLLSFSLCSYQVWRKYHKGWALWHWGAADLSSSRKMGRQHWCFVYKVINAT